MFCHYNKHSQELGHSAKVLVGSANILLVAQKCPCVTMTTSESRNFSQAQSSPILAPMQCICGVWIFSAESSAAQWLTSALSGHLARASEAGGVSGW